MKDQAIAKLSRENHISTLINNLPLFTILYGVQCAMAHFYFYDIVNPGHFATVLGLTLTSLITCLFLYDKYHHIIIYKDHILIYSQIFGASKKVSFESIEEIAVPEEECLFGSVSLVLKNKDIINFQFIDYPVQVKEILLKFQREFFESKQEEVDSFENAA